MFRLAPSSSNNRLLITQMTAAGCSRRILFLSWTLSYLTWTLGRSLLTRDQCTILPHHLCTVATTVRQRCLQFLFSQHCLARSLHYSTREWFLKAVHESIGRCDLVPGNTFQFANKFPTCAVSTRETDVEAFRVSSTLYTPGLMLPIESMHLLLSPFLQASRHMVQHTGFS